MTDPLTLSAPPEVAATVSANGMPELFWWGPDLHGEDMPRTNAVFYIRRDIVDGEVAILQHRTQSLREQVAIITAALDLMHIELARVTMATE